VVQHASAWLQQHPVGKRFVWIHLYDPHDPYEPPAPYAAQYAKDPYSGEIAYADAQIAKLLSLLKRQGRYQNAAIILLADHGEGLGEHGENTHGIFLYDSTLRIPLVVKLPKNDRAGAAVADQVSTIDVFPTIMELAGAATPSSLEGRSLLASARPKSRVVISETDYPLRFGWAPIKSARTVGGKYIDAPRPEYYELSNDPGEKENIYTPWNAEVQSLREEVARVRKNSTPGTNAVPGSTVSELQALGYLGTVAGSTTAADLTTLPDPKDKIEVQNLIHDGMVEQDRGRLKEALLHFSKAVALDAQSPNTLLLLGTAELKTGDYRRAAQHLQAAAILRGDDAAIAAAYGEALFRMGDLQAAATVLQKAASASSGLYNVRVLLGEIFLQQNALERAADQLEAAVLIEPNKPGAYITLAKVKAAQGDAAGARAQLTIALKKDPENSDAKRLLDELRRPQ
jgi:Tfp pilus assembly protein PilF